MEHTSTFVLGDDNSIKYYYNDIFRRNINSKYKNISLNFSDKHNKIKDTCNLTQIHSLNMSNCDNIKDIGNLRKLKKLIINKYIEGIHLLRELDELILNNDLIKCNKISRRIKKLKLINPTIKIEVIN